MALNQKQKKKLTRWVSKTDDRLNALLTDQAAQYFAVFMVALSWDFIANMLLIRHSEGINWEQSVIMGICLIQMVRLSRKIKK